MARPDYLILGRITKAHGIRGEAKVVLAEGRPALDGVLDVVVEKEVVHFAPRAG